MPQLALTEAVFYILLSLQKPLHGYGIIQNVGELSHGRVKLAAGTLYGALNSLVEKGWIDALPENPESRKKEYVITPSGLNVLKEELARLSELVDNGKRILGGN
jgi:DNA-binding PadR family transcriptional regulator